MLFNFGILLYLLNIFLKCFYLYEKKLIKLSFNLLEKNCDNFFFYIGLEEGLLVIFLIRVLI